MFKVISKDGETSQYFLDAGQVFKKRAQGVMQAIESVSLSTLGEKATEYVLKKVSPIVIDDASVNSGEKVVY